MVKNDFNLRLDVLLIRRGQEEGQILGGRVGEEGSRFINVEFAIRLIAAGFMNME